MPLALRLILLAALLVGAATTGVMVMSARWSGWRAAQGAWIEESFRTLQNDRAAAQRLSELIGAREIEWLRRESFTHPWHDDRIAPVRELALFDVNQQGVVDPHLEDAAGRLANAARSFLRVYDRETIADPIVPYGSWRMIGRNRASKETLALTEQERIVSQTRLSEAAAEICNSHAEFSLLATNVFPPN